MSFKGNYSDKVIDSLDSISFQLDKLINEIRGNYKRVNIHALVVDRIGHLAMNTELFLRRCVENKENNTNSKTYELLINVLPDEKVSNKQLLKMIKRAFPVVADSTVSNILRMMAQQNTELFDLNQGFLYSESNEFHEFNSIPPQLSFTEEEEEEGQKLLRQMGIEEGAVFVCLHTRDSAYLNKKLPGVNWKYHDYRDCSIDNYLPAAEYLAEQGIYVLRMGEVITKPLDTVNDKIIDYASSFRSDFGDVYLTSHCKFFLGCTAGLFLVSSIFGVPNANANHTPFGFTPLLRDDIFIPKNYWYTEEKRFLTFREQMESRMDCWGLYGSSFDKLGIEVVENTQDEILGLTKELNERLDGKWQITEEDEELQKHFMSFLRPGVRGHGYPGRIAAEFLKKHRNLLD